MSRPPSGPPPDHGARARATTEFGRNLVVTAGAGTGKTAILVERTLNMIGSGESPLARLALITFTDKAAAELRQRLGSGLDRLLRRVSGDRSPLDPARDADRSWEWLAAAGQPAGEVRGRVLAALDELDAASVGTIHGFCLDILRRHPREALIDPRSAVGEDPALDRLFEEAWDRFLRGPDGPARRADPWRRALGAHAAPGMIRDLGEALARFALPPAALGPYSPPPLTEVLGATIDAALARVRDLRARARNVPGTMTRLLELTEAWLDRIRRDGLDPNQAGDLEEALRPHLGSLPSAGARLAGATPREVTEAARAARDLLRAIAEVDETAVAAAHEVARPLATAVQAHTLSRGVVPFDAMLRLARELLARHPEVRRRVRARFRQLLVDEFQDTDPLQYEVLFLLAAVDGGDRAADAWRADLEPGRLFIVGDPKQSIYRFRHADIAAFRRAVDRVLACGGDELRLTASFRSPARLLEPINRLFRGWLGPDISPDRDPDRGWEGHYAPPYIAIEPAAGPEPPGPPRVCIWSVDAGPRAGAEAGRRHEASAIAAHIAGRIADGGADRRAPGDFAVLFRALTHVGLYTRALQRAGVPCIVEGGRDFGERPEVGDLLSFLRAVASPNDGPALLAVLRSPLGAVPDAELASFAREHRLDAVSRAMEGSPGAAEAPDWTRFPALGRARDLLIGFRRRVAGRPPDEVIQAALATTPIALLHATAGDGPQRIANLRKCEAMARQHAASGLTLAEILAELESTFAADQGEGESPLADETLDAVRLLSVHRAKGLEFEVVVVPDLGRQDGGGRRDASAEAAWLTTGDGDGRLAVRLPDGRRNAASVLHQIEGARHEEAEERRVFYVACTRAREELILVNSRGDRTAAWRDRLHALGYALGDGGTFPGDGVLADGLVEHRVVRIDGERRAEPAAFEPAPLVAAAEAHARAAAALAAAAGAPLHRPSGSRAEDPAEAGDAAPRRRRPVADRGSDPGQVARLAGLAVHAALESWDFRDAAALRAAARSAGRRFGAREAGTGSAAEALQSAVAAEVGAILAGFLASSLPLHLSEVAILAREAPIVYRDPEGRAWAGACDLVYRDSRGVVVADYKTDVPGADPGAHAESYHGQMSVYVQAVRAALPGETVRGAILLLRSGETIFL